MRLLSAVVLLPEVVVLGGRGAWAKVRGCSTIVPKVLLAPRERRDSVGDGEGDQGGTVAEPAVDVEMFAAESRKDDGGAFPSLDLIFRG